ncbi:unnamed protein product [Urochloa humidicola]
MCKFCHSANLPLNKRWTPCASATAPSPSLTNPSRKIYNRKWNYQGGQELFGKQSILDNGETGVMEWQLQFHLFWLLQK